MWSRASEGRQYQRNRRRCALKEATPQVEETRREGTKDLKEGEEEEKEEKVREDQISKEEAAGVLHVRVSTDLRMRLSAFPLPVQLKLTKIRVSF